MEENKQVSLEDLEERFKEGDIIFCEYEPGDYLYIIKEGEVRISKIQKDKEKILDILKPGSIFGEMALIENDRRSATAIAETDVVLIKIKRENFELLTTTNPGWALSLMKLLSKRIYDAKRRLEILSHKDPELKVIDTLLMVVENMYVNLKEAPSTVELKIKIDDIGAWCGMDSKQAYQILQRYQGMGKISIYSEKIVINNLQDLIRIVQMKKKMKNV